MSVFRIHSQYGLYCVVGIGIFGVAVDLGIQQQFPVREYERFFTYQFFDYRYCASVFILFEQRHSQFVEQACTIVRTIGHTLQVLLKPVKTIAMVSRVYKVYGFLIVHFWIAGEYTLQCSDGVVAITITIIDKAFLDSDKALKQWTVGGIAAMVT